MKSIGLRSSEEIEAYKQFNQDRFVAGFDGMDKFKGLNRKNS